MMGLFGRALGAMRSALHGSSPWESFGKPRWVFVSGDDGWVLTGICREIMRHGSLHARLFTNGYRLPKTDYYFFAHFSRLMQFLENPKPSLKRVVLFTHFEDSGKRSVAEVLGALKEADKVVCLATRWREWLVDHGLQDRKVRVVVGGADPQRFQHHERSGRTVGFVSRFYPRKNPELVAHLVERMSDASFILLGTGWERWPGFGALCARQNFQYVRAEYSEYPAIYRRMDVFVSASTVEGGPIPLVEAMMSNVVPVVSRTGFAPEIIRDGENGFLFDVGWHLETIIALIRRGLELRVNVRETIEHLTWKNFAQQLLAFVYE